MRALEYSRAKRDIFCDIYITRWRSGCTNRTRQRYNAYCWYLLAIIYTSQTSAYAYTYIRIYIFIIIIQCCDKSRRHNICDTRASLTRRVWREETRADKLSLRYTNWCTRCRTISFYAGSVCVIDFSKRHYTFWPQPVPESKTLGVRDAV